MPHVFPERQPDGDEEPERRSIHEILALLKAPIDPKFIKYIEKEMKKAPYTKTKVPFITGQTLMSLLDRHVPEWSREVIRTELVAGRIIVTVRLLIPCREGIVFREGIGSAADTPLENGEEKYGGPVKKATALAFKDAAKQFGLGRNLTGKDATEQPDATQSRPRVVTSQTLTPAPQPATPSPVRQVAQEKIEDERQKLFTEIDGIGRALGFTRQGIEEQVAAQWPGARFDQLGPERLRQMVRTLREAQITRTQEQLRRTG